MDQRAGRLLERPDGRCGRGRGPVKEIRDSVRSECDASSLGTGTLHKGRALSRAATTALGPTSSICADASAVKKLKRGTGLPCRRDVRSYRHAPENRWVRAACTVAVCCASAVSVPTEHSSVHPEKSIFSFVSRVRTAYPALQEVRSREIDSLRHPPPAWQVRRRRGTLALQYRRCRGLSTPWSSGRHLRHFQLPMTAPPSHFTGCLLGE